MISIILNNQPIIVAPHATLADILIQQGYQNTPFAIAINQNFIPKSQYSNTLLNNQDVIDVVSPMQGG